MTISPEALAEAIEFDIWKHGSYGGNDDYYYRAYIKPEYVTQKEWRQFDTELKWFESSAMTISQIQRWAERSIPHELMCRYLADIWNRNYKKSTPGFTYTLRHICFDEVRDIYQPWYDNRAKCLRFDFYIEDYAWLPVGPEMFERFRSMCDRYLDGTYPYQGDAELCSRWNEIVDAEEEA